MSEQRAPQQTGSELIAAERQRQIVKEGWTPEHDQTHQAGDLSQAGICYATMGNLQITMNINAAPVGVAKNWPWSRHWWKPANNPIRNLVKAGALIAAEIDRLLDDEPAASLPDSQPQGERVQVTPLCRCPEGVCLMHPNSPGYDKKCSLRHPVSQPSPSGDTEQELEDVVQRMRAALQESPK